MKLISLNIERNKHLERVLPFLKKEDADIVCLQEIYESNLPLFEVLGYTSSFLPMTLMEVSSTDEKMGVAILCRNTKQQQVTSFYYSKEFTEIPKYIQSGTDSSIMHGALFAECSIDGKTFLVGTTHFTWTPIGDRPSDRQKAHMGTFLDKIKTIKQHLMCGDFNIPRLKNPLYEKLILNYTDSIPLSFTSSLDKNLHKAGDVPEAAELFESYMVDYVFTQSPYVASDVRLEFGVSDHAAVVATIEKIE
jgi:exonuclease III